jgi:DNA-binding transcriptional LysR family regulator
VQLDLLRTFLVILEEGSLNRAATRLHLGQSSLSRQIATLEHEVGTRLLERSARGMAPTAAGQALADGLRRPLREIEAAMVQTRAVGRGERTELRIGYLQSAAGAYLNPALAAVRAAHPGIKITLLDSCAGGQMRALRQGELDVGLIGHEARLLAKEFYTRKLRRLPVVAALPADHPLAERASVCLADLRKEVFVGKQDGESPGDRDWITHLCRQAGFRPRFASESDSIAHALSLVVSEGAVALLPEFVKDQRAASVVFRPVSDPAAKWDFFVVWQRGQVAAPVRVLLDALPSTRTPERPPVEALKSA